VKFRLIQADMVQVMNDDGSFTGVVIRKNPQGGYLIEGRGRHMKAGDRETAKQAASDISLNIVGTHPKEDIGPQYTSSSDAWTPRGVPYGPYSG